MLEWGRTMNEELPKNDDVLHEKQIITLTQGGGRVPNRQRCYVSSIPICFFMLLAIAGLSLWLLRLLNLIPLPF